MQNQTMTIDCKTFWPSRSSSHLYTVDKGQNVLQPVANVIYPHQDQFASYPQHSNEPLLYHLHHPPHASCPLSITTITLHKYQL